MNIIRPLIKVIEPRLKESKESYGTGRFALVFGSFDATDDIFHINRLI